MTDDGDERAESADTMRERSARSDWVAYLLLDADRRVVAVGLLLAVFASLVAVAMLVGNPGTVLRTGDPIETLFQALVGSTITGVTLVLTLNQLVLSQELGAVGDQRERMEEAMTFRRDVADVLDDPIAPAEPSAFLRALVEATAERGGGVRAALEDYDADDEVAERIDDLVDDIEGNADSVVDQLDGATFGSFGVVSAALDFNYSLKLYTARWIRVTLDDADVPDTLTDAVDDLVDVLELFGPAREHFKTLYFQSELIDLSRTILASALPAIVVAVSVLAFLDGSTVTGTVPVIEVDALAVLIAATVTASLSPFVILLSYVLRIATVTGRTLSIGPFVLRQTDRSTDR